jgi:predicted RNase H-like HicB family nuclease
VIVEYIARALRNAVYDKLEDGTFVAEVPGLQGVLATAPTLEACRDQLSEVVEGWVLFRVANGLDVPALDGITVTATTVD